MRLEGDRADLLAEEAARVVLGAGAALLDDDLALGVDLLGIEQQVLHAIGLEVDDEIDLVAGDVDEVRRDVLRGERVVLAAVLLDEPRELLGSARRRALEHHVLEEVRDAGRAALLVARADAIPHLERHDRAAVVLEQQDAQPVVERGGHDPVRGRRRRRGKEHDDRQEGDDDAHRLIIPNAAPPAVVSSSVMRSLGIAALLVVLALPQSALAQPCTESLATLFERVSPTVVSIQAVKINKAKPQRRFETVVGSGVVIERDGQVLTNAHVVDGAASLSVTLDSGVKTPARVLGMDTVTDLALLRLEGTTPLPAARLGDSSALRVGEEVVAIGNPIGLEQTMTRGIVSGLNRILPGLAEQPMIQTDAPINPGNSGGPLVDRCGAVMGINTFISEEANSIGFALPINAGEGGAARPARDGARRPPVARAAGPRDRRPDRVALPDAALPRATSSRSCTREARPSGPACAAGPCRWSSRARSTSSAATS